MTHRQETIAKFTLVGLVIIFVLFFTRPQGKFQAVGLGDVVPDFTLRNDAGQPVSLASYRGKIVVLNFFASWCVPCVEELPSLKQLTARYADKGVVIIGISRDPDPDAYKEFLSRFQLNFLTMRNASNSVGEMYGTYQLPETYIISRDGHLINKIIGGTDWTSRQMLDYFDSLLTAS